MTQTTYRLRAHSSTGKPVVFCPTDRINVDSSNAIHATDGPDRFVISEDIARTSFDQDPPEIFGFDPLEDVIDVSNISKDKNQFRIKALGNRGNEERSKIQFNGKGIVRLEIGANEISIENNLVVEPGNNPALDVANQIHSNANDTSNAAKTEFDNIPLSSLEKRIPSDEDLIKDLPSPIAVEVSTVRCQNAIMNVFVLGQSNAQGLRVEDGDNVSGLDTMYDALTESDLNCKEIVMPTNEEIQITSIGSSHMSNPDEPDDKSWWNLEENKPGPVLINALPAMKARINGQSKTDPKKNIIVLGIGETDSFPLGSDNSEEALGAQQRYFSTTLAVLNHIKQELGGDVTFHIMRTGRYNVAAAKEAGISEGRIEAVQRGLTHIRRLQDELALTRPDVSIAVDYRDLDMRADVDPNYKTDVWHLRPKEREDVGRRLGKAIAETILRQEKNFEHTPLHYNNRLHNSYSVAKAAIEFAAPEM